MVYNFPLAHTSKVAFESSFPFAETDYERTACFGYVSRVYEYDCHLFYLEGNGAYQLARGASASVLG